MFGTGIFFFFCALICVAGAEKWDVRVTKGVLKGEVQCVNVAQDTYELIVRLCREPITGMQMSSAQVTPDALENLEQQHINTVSLSLPPFWKGEKEMEETRRVVAAIHEHDLLLFWLVGLSPVSYDDYLSKDSKEIYKVDWQGSTLKRLCFRNPSVRAAAIKAMIEAGGKMKEQGISLDGLIINEPGQPRGEFCYCAHCQKTFKERYGIEMPLPAVKKGLGSSIPVVWSAGVPKATFIKKGEEEIWKKMAQFYCEPVTERIGDIFQSFRKSFPYLSCQVTTITDIAPFYGLDFWNGVLNLDDLDGIQTAIYWAVGNKPANVVGDRRVAQRFVGAAKKKNISCYYWLQGYDCGDNSKPLKSGDIIIAVKEAFARDVDGILIWSYLNPIRGPWDSPYTWNEYGKELSTAVAPYLNQPAEKARIVVTSDGKETVLIGDGTDGKGKDGTYRIQVAAPRGKIEVSAFVPHYRVFTENITLHDSSASVRPTITSVMIYHNDEVVSKIVDFCKKYEIDEVQIPIRNLKEKNWALYKEAGLKVVAFQISWRQWWDKEKKKIEEDSYRTEIALLGQKNLEKIDGFLFDEPSWGFGDWEKERLPELENDQGLRASYRARFGEWPTLSEKRDQNPDSWRKTVWWRQRIFAERMVNIINTYMKVFPSKEIQVNFSPVYYESGSHMGIDMELFRDLPRDCVVLTDPYFQAFRRPLQWSGFLIRWLQSTLGNRPLGGVVQYYDAIKDSGWPAEGYMPLEEDDIRRETFAYLMHGASRFPAFVVCARTLDRTAELEALGESLQFVKAHRDLWENTRTISQVGVYFSENTFRMKDMWGPWSRMTGLYGTSFQTEHTYYALSYLHIPVGIVSMAFNEEKDLLMKLQKYKVMVVPDAGCVSEYEADCFRKYVEEGGTLIATGESFLYDENGVSRKQPLLSSLFGVKTIEIPRRSLVKIVDSVLTKKSGVSTISTDGNATKLFRRQAERHSDWLKEKCVQMKYTGYDLKFPEKLPEPSFRAVLPDKDTIVLAVYEDDSVAAILRQYGKGRFIYVAPSDLLLFNGEVTDCLEPIPDEQAGGVNLLGALVENTLDKERFLSIEAPATVEIALREKEAGKNERTIYFLNHKNKDVPALTVSVFSAPPEKVTLWQPGQDPEVLPVTLMKEKEQQGFRFTIPVLRQCAIITL